MDEGFFREKNIGIDISGYSFCVSECCSVSMTTPANGASSYEFSGQSHNVFKNFVKDEVFQQHGESLGLVNPEENGGEELLYLGAYMNSDF